MADHKPLYRWSLQDAVTHNEVQDWRDSYRENCDCARAIERAIADQYHDNILENGTKDIIDRYGFDRVNWVLANTLQEKAHDGRFSQDNKRWAKGFFIPSDDVRWHFCVESHPGLTDLFINQTREAWQKLGLFDASHCSEDIKHIRKSVRKEIFDYLHSLPLNIDIEVNGQPYILVHGGAIAAYHNYMYRYDNQEEYAVWNRIYYYEPDIEGKIIIFGHTPTSEYQHNNPLEIWRSPSGGKIGIDCGSGFPHPLSQGRHPAYGRLACLRLDDMKVFYSEEDIPEEVKEIVW